MEINELYQFVLLLVMIGLILGVGVLTLDKFQTANSISGTANTTLSDTVTAITPIASTWLPLIVTIVVLSIILTLVIRSFVVKR